MDQEVSNLRNTIKRVTVIFVTVAIFLAALFTYSFIQLQGKEDRLESYSLQLGGAPVISGNYPLQSSPNLKLEKTDDGYKIVLVDGAESGLNADLLDNNDSSFFTNATNLISGILNTDRYSAWSDLEAEGFTADGKIRSEFLSTVAGEASDLTGYAT